MPTHTQMIEQFDTHYRLGEASMDKTHHEFLQLCVQTLSAQGEQFADRFATLLEHTRSHFAQEEARMRSSAFPSSAEHYMDHQRILGEMDRFNQRVHAGRSTMARAWLADSLSSWFDLHAKTMDSALAAHLKDQN